jgi:hypothetical protein
MDVEQFPLSGRDFPVKVRRDQLLKLVAKHPGLSL